MTMFYRAKLWPEMRFNLKHLAEQQQEQQAHTTPWATAPALPLEIRQLRELR